MPQRPKYILPDISESSHNVGQNIAALRKKKGLSQKELALKIGITQALLSHYETARLSIPVEVVIQISISLNVHADVILGIGASAPLDDDSPSRRIVQRAKLIERLPAFDQKALLKTIDNALKGAGITTEDPKVSH